MWEGLPDLVDPVIGTVQRLHTKETEGLLAVRSTSAKKSITQFNRKGGVLLKDSWGSRNIAKTWDGAALLVQQVGIKITMLKMSNVVLVSQRAEDRQLGDRKPAFVCEQK
jgi:hypothetical protein